MTVYEPYPDRVTVNGREILLDLSYDRVLMAFDILGMYELTTLDRFETVCRILIRSPEDIPQDLSGMAIVLSEILKLFPSNAEQADKTIDFHQDAALIRSAFFRIGIDLTKEKINIFQFLELLGDLPKDTALMRVIDIRTRPIPKVTEENRDQVAELQRLKQKFAIRLSDEERLRNFAKSLRKSSILMG